MTSSTSRPRSSPPTIDNDIPYLDRSFGFQTPFAEATRSIRAAHVEARSTPVLTPAASGC